jgi:hypothetical protein
LEFFGFTQLVVDHTLFTKATKSDFTTILIYVDDLVLTGSSMNEIQSVKQFLHGKFGIKDMGELSTS